MIYNLTLFPLALSFYIIFDIIMLISLKGGIIMIAYIIIIVLIVVISLRIIRDFANAPLPGEFTSFGKDADDNDDNDDWEYDEYE